MPSFDVAAVESGITGTRFAGLVRHFESVGSTNTLALEAAQAGAAGGIWVADEQTAGRGRGGHGWHSAPGDGLYCAVLTMPRIPSQEALRVPLAAGLAARAAIMEVADIHIDLRWPNDVMVDGKKCGGILVETASETERLRYAVIGVGINLNHPEFPKDLAGTATSLRLAAGREFGREEVLAALLRNLDRTLVSLDTVLRHFSAASSWVSGKRVNVGEQGGYTGVTQGLDKRGFLRVLADDGTMRTVISGGVREA